MLFLNTREYGDELGLQILGREHNIPEVHMRESLEYSLKVLFVVVLALNLLLPFVHV